MAANKMKGIRAAQCHDVYSAERAAKSNNAQIITFGELMSDPKWLSCWSRHGLKAFLTGGPSARNIEKIMSLEGAWVFSRRRTQPQAKVQRRFLLFSGCTRYIDRRHYRRLAA